MTKERIDDEIISLIKVQRKTEQGYRLLMDTYQQPLYWQIRKLVVLHEDAHDVLQNTLIKVFKNMDRFKGESRLYTWMYRIATNESLTHLKKKQRKATTSMDDETTFSAALKADPYFDGSELMARLYTAMEALPPKQKQVFQMRYFDEMKYDEISSLLGTTVGGLKATYHHAAKKIEQHFLK